jgi:hypothetical protein
MIQLQYNLADAYNKSIYHRDEILRSELCGCFFCLKVFTPSEITHWVDMLASQPTALCPRCGADSVIGSASGYPITAGFLKQMHARWFGK